MTGARVLVIEDEVDVRSLIVVVLEEQGYELAELESGVGAVEKVFEFKPDLIILDVTMPVVDGFAALELLKNVPSTRDVPVLMASAQGQKSTLLRAKELGALDFMVKPWDEGELEWRVANCLNRRGNSLAA